MKQKIPRDAQYHKRLIEGVIAVALLCGIVWFLLNGQPAGAPSSTDLMPNYPTSQTNPGNTPPKNTPATNTPAGKDVVVVSTQTAGSKSVTVDNVTLSKPGFVVIAEVGVGGEGGSPTPISAFSGISKYLTTGSKQDLVITLNQKLDPNKEYFAEIYQDNGDKKFNPKIDEEIRQSISPIFTAK